MTTHIGQCVLSHDNIYRTTYFLCIYCILYTVYIMYIFFDLRWRFPPLPWDFTVLYNDPAAPQDHCGRCWIRTRDFCPRSLERYQMSHHIHRTTWPVTWQHPQDNIFFSNNVTEHVVLWMLSCNRALPPVLLLKNMLSSGCCHVWGVVVLCKLSCDRPRFPMDDGM